MKIYLSGPITNVLDFKERFAKAEERLKMAKDLIILKEEQWERDI